MSPIFIQRGSWKGHLTVSLVYTSSKSWCVETDSRTLFSMLRSHFQIALSHGTAMSTWVLVLEPIPHSWQRLLITDFVLFGLWRLQVYLLLALSGSANTIRSGGRVRIHVHVQYVTNFYGDMHPTKPLGPLSLYGIWMTDNPSFVKPITSW